MTPSQLRREQLQRLAGKRLAKVLQRVTKKYSHHYIDIEMQWPAKGESIDFLASANKSEIAWEFSIPAFEWHLVSDPPDDLPDGIHGDVRHFFAEVWKEISSKAPNSHMFFRLHDSGYSVDLLTGVQVVDYERADHVEPKRKPFAIMKGSPKPSNENGELIRRGDSLQKVKEAYKITEEPNPGPRFSQYDWQSKGIRINIENDEVAFVSYLNTFNACICGIWIGAHAHEVDQILGRAKHEFQYADRLWHYDIDGFMSVGFDENDCVDFIGR